MTDTKTEMENLCKELFVELLEASEQLEELQPLVATIKQLDLAYEILPTVQTVDRDLLYYWIQDEAKSLMECSVEEIVERQKRHVARQKALEEWMRYEIIRSKTRESTTYLLLNKMMAGMTEEQKKRVSSLMKKRVTRKGSAPKRAKIPAERGIKKGVRALMAMGYSQEEAEAMSK